MSIKENETSQRSRFTPAFPISNAKKLLEKQECEEMRCGWAVPHPFLTTTECSTRSDVQAEHCSLFGAVEGLTHKSTGGFYFPCFHCLSCSPIHCCDLRLIVLNLPGRIRATSRLFPSKSVYEQSFLCSEMSSL